MVPLHDVDGVGGLSHVVQLKLLEPCRQAWSIEQLLVVRVVQALLSSKGDFSFYLHDFREPHVVFMELVEIPTELVGEEHHHY